MIKTHEPYKPMYTDTEKFIILVTGGRGCERPGQEILMADLSVKQIKDIQIGDKVMGINGSREVLDIHRGYGRMYKVQQSVGKDYYVNDGHIITLLHEGELYDTPIIGTAFLNGEKYSGVRLENGVIRGHDLVISEEGFGDWVGIEVDGDRHYLHPDGTILHNSGKSFNAGTFIERLTFEYNAAKKIAHQILFTRYTMTSAQISVIPEFLEKVDLDGTANYFHKSNNDVVNTMTKSRVMFRGIHTSSGNQTAKLKSIQGITTFVVDEAEEWVSESEFERIMLSIRTKGLQNRVIIIMNPCDSNHWVYKRFIEKTHHIEYFDGVPVQISDHPSVLHIHTSYLDNIENLSEEFMKEVLLMKKNDPEKYAHIVMGRWADVAEGAVFKKWGIVDEFPSYAKKVARCVDFGYTNDVTAIARCGIVDNRLYIDELCYRVGMTSGDLIREFRQEAEHGDDGFVYAESADPRLTDEIAMGGIIIYPVAKGAGSIEAGLSKMQDMEIFFTKRSVNGMDEARKYVWAKDRNGVYINEPEDHDNHIMDAVRYYVLHVLCGHPIVTRKVTKQDLGVY